MAMVVAGSEMKDHWRERWIRVRVGTTSHHSDRNAYRVKERNLSSRLDSNWSLLITSQTLLPLSHWESGSLVTAYSTLVLIIQS